jgi:predicted alpha/beta-fold hydrolase
MKYTAANWLPGGHLQTIWPAYFSKRVNGAPIQYTRQRWASPDRDFIDVDYLAGTLHAVPNPVLLVLFHGLEGSSASHYAEAFADYARQQQIAFAVPHFRGCSGEINLAPRAYHSGDFEEVDWILRKFRQSHSGPIIAVGVSLGGNALLRWVQEMGQQAKNTVAAIAAISAPLDLAAAGLSIGKGLNRLFYTRMFLHSMKPKALKKLQQHPGLFSKEALLAVKDLYAFDNVFTAPLHGFKNTEDYWSRASAKPYLNQIQIPSLVVNAKNDPFIPSYALPTQKNVSKDVTLWQPAMGGHAGFPHGPFPGHIYTMPSTVGAWLMQYTS